jgi:hypothetical protein
LCRHYAPPARPEQAWGQTTMPFKYRRHA